MNQEPEIKGVLYGTRAYLSGNLETANDADIKSWRDKTKKALKKRGIIPLDPTEVVFEGQHLETPEKRQELRNNRDAGKLEEVRNYMVEVVKKDLRQVDLSDFVIFNIDTTTPTYGTTHELVVSIQQKKPIFVATNDRTKVPLWILGIVHPKYIYDNVSDILRMIYSIDSGRTEIDSERWRLLKTELR